jgi:hypothetical protein
LIALLNSSTEFIKADLWTFTLQDGTTFLLSGEMLPVTDAATGRVFGLGPRIDRSAIRIVVGIQSDELDVRIYPDPTDLLGTVAGTMGWAQAVWRGEFDAATVQLERAFMPSWGDTSPGTIVLFLGRVSDIDVGRTMIMMKVRSLIELLNVQMPRRLWQPSCNHVFGGPMCGYDRVNGANADGTPTGVGQITFPCTAGSTSTLILGSTASSTYYQGTIIGLTGPNIGQRRTVTGVVPGQIAVKRAFLSTPNPGDQFQVLPGCDRTLPTCGNIFLNSRVTPNTPPGYNAAHAERFGGFPFVPVAENAV